MHVRQQNVVHVKWQSVSNTQWVVCSWAVRLQGAAVHAHWCIYMDSSITAKGCFTSFVNDPRLPFKLTRMHTAQIYYDVSTNLCLKQLEGYSTAYVCQYDLLGQTGTLYPLSVSVTVSV
jgi:hypothetical protein